MNYPGLKSPDTLVVPNGVPATAMERFLYAALMETRREMQMLMYSIRNVVNFSYHPEQDKLPPVPVFPADSIVYALYGDSRRTGIDPVAAVPHVPGFECARLEGIRLSHLTTEQKTRMWEDLVARGTVNDLTFRPAGKPTSVHVNLLNGDSNITWMVNAEGDSFSYSLVSFLITLPVEGVTVDVARDPALDWNQRPGLPSGVRSLIEQYFQAREWPLDWIDALRDDTEYDGAYSRFRRHYRTALADGPHLFQFRGREIALVSVGSVDDYSPAIHIRDGERTVQIRPPEDCRYMNDIYWDYHLQVRAMIMQLAAEIPEPIKEE